MKRLLVVGMAVLFAVPHAHAFCGFYVAKGDTKIFNQASQVVIARDGDRTVMTMANDFQGAPKDFAVVIPVPTAITRQQIHVADKKLIDHLDAYSSPRLVEYYDPDPCSPPVMYESPMAGVAMDRAAKSPAAGRANSLGVTIEARYTVGEYDILILSATQSSGLATWLVENGYRIPDGAQAVLGSYIRQNMKFFVAKVNLTEQSKLGYSYLRPIQVAYNSPKFMLPIRLGTVNAKGPQELFIYTITRNGRVETTNYRTVKLPSDAEIPLYVRDNFADFYKAVFSEQVRRESMEPVFLEYAWNMNWCDPCAADPLTRDELRSLGVMWVNDAPNASMQAFITRMHVRYDRAHFPEDLAFQETGDTANFQARFILRHPFQGKGNCPAARNYQVELREREQRQAETLARLTGWERVKIHKEMRLTEPVKQERSWWEGLWN